MANKNENRRSPILREIIIIITSILLGSVATFYFHAWREIKLRKYDLMTEFHCRTAELFNQATFVADALIRKYGFDRVNRSDIPEQELVELNSVIKDLNNQLYKMYLITPDDSYGRIVEAMPIGVDKLGHFRNQVLPELRRAQFKKTKYTDPNDIRFFKLK